VKKAIIIIVGILLVIIISAVFILPRVVTLDKFKGKIEGSLEASLNREVSLGDIGLVLWPGIGAEVKDVKIANLAGFSKGDFVRIKSLQVLIQFLPLLSGNIEVDKCILTEPRIWIEKNAAGDFNFSDLVKEEKEVAKPTPEEEKTPEFIKGLMVSKAAIDGGEVHYVDYSRPKKKSTSLKDVDLHLKNISIDRPVELDLSFRLQEISEKIHVKGTVGPLGKEIDIMSSPVAITLESKDLALKPFGKFLEDGTNLGGLLSLCLAVKGKANETLNLDLDSSIKGLSYNEKQKMLVKDMDVAFKEKAILNLKREILDIKDLRLELQGVPVTIKGRINQFKEHPNVDLKATAQNIPLEKWQQVSPLLQEMVDLKGDITLRADFKGKSDKLINISLLLNSGRLEIDRVNQMKPGLQKKQPIERKAQTQKQGVKAKEEIAGHINLAGKVTIGQGRFEKVKFNNLSANLTKKGNVFELTNMVFHTFKGKVTAKGGVDMRNATPRFSFTTKVDGAELNQIYNTFASPKDLLFGLLATDFTADGVGFKEEEFTKNLNASGRFDLKDGRITSFDLLREIALITKLMGVETSGKETRFNDLSMNFSIKSGKIFTDNLSLIMKDMKLAASGYIGLDKSIDLSARAWLSPRFKAPEFTQYLFERDENGRLIVPFRIAGTLLTPKLALDTKALKARVQKQIKEQIEKGVEKIPVEEELKGIFKDILPGRKK